MEIIIIVILMIVFHRLIAMAVAATVWFVVAFVGTIFLLIQSIFTLGTRKNRYK